MKIQPNSMTTDKCFVLLYSPLRDLHSPLVHCNTYQQNKMTKYLAFSSKSSIVLLWSSPGGTIPHQTTL